MVFFLYSSDNIKEQGDERGLGHRIHPASFLIYVSEETEAQSEQVTAQVQPDQQSPLCSQVSCSPPWPTPKSLCWQKYQIANLVDRKAVTWSGFVPNSSLLFSLGSS